MNKQEIEHKLEQARKDRDDINESVQQLEEQLRDTEKPKRRHGDFGINQGGMYRIILFSNGESVGGNLGERDDYCPYGRVGDSDITVFGNIFDLMDGWDKPFEEYYKGNCAMGIRIEGEHIEIYSCTGVDCDKENDHCNFDIEKAKEWYSTLGHAIADLKRKENKND